MKAISTPITRLLNIKTPIISAAMAGASGGELAAKVTGAGGFGFMAAGYNTEAQIRKELDLARTILSRSNDDAEDSSKSLRIGVGFLGWILDKEEGKTPGTAAGLLSIVLDARVAAVWLSFGNDLGRWVKFIREFDGKRSDPHKTLVFVLVNSLDEARVAIDEWEVDVLVAEGIESGGHGRGDAPPLFALVTDILHKIPKNRLPPLLAAGGIVSGPHVAALLALGASGAVLGTRFVLTPESLYSVQQKDALKKAVATDTIRTTAFDILRGTTGWPACINGRAIYNDSVKRVEEGVDLKIAKALFEKATRENDPSGMLMWSGLGIGQIEDIKPAAEVVSEIHDELSERLRSISSLL